jgi:hypothetical protein
MWKTSRPDATSDGSESPRGSTSDATTRSEATSRETYAVWFRPLVPNEAADNARARSVAPDIDSPAVSRCAEARPIGSDSVHERAKSPADPFDTTTDLTSVVQARLTATSDRT